MNKAKELVIDSDELFVNSICLLLESYKLNAEGEVATKSALEKLGSFKPDIVLLEIFTSGNKNNCEDIRLLNQKTDVPIIVITSYPELLTDTLIEEYKITDYIIKPFTIDELMGVIRKHLDIL